MFTSKMFSKPLADYLFALYIKNDFLMLQFSAPSAVFWVGLF